MLSSHPIDHALARTPAFAAGGRVLVAVSGGADSMALLAAAADHAARGGARVVAAHFDHRIRRDSARDIDTVRALADAHGIRVVAGAGDVPARARSARVSMETAAREARYEFLRDAAARESCNWIATAHTRSDQVETVLMRILRGAGARGLAGIARERDSLVRPLLDVARADTLDYCARHGIAFVTDPSNDDRRFARNAVRHDTLPALRRAFPTIDDALLRTSRGAEEALRAARLVTDVRLGRLCRDNGAWVLPVDAFAGLDESEVAILLGDVLERIGCLAGVTAVHYGHVRALARAERVGASVDLPGVSVRRDHDALVWRVRGVEVNEELRAAPLSVPGAVELNGWIVRALRADELAGSEACSTRFHEARFQPSRAKCLSGEQASLPVRQLTVRSPRPGDRIRPFGMSGSKKLSDIFIDKKIPHRDRARAVVIESGGEIVWVPGVVASESTRVSGDGMPLIHITAESASPGGPA
ncbi:MAG: tRNA lysidine(34) synthetase TilS [Candidatus Krumholzibacteria bacterium]|nr:tRNA lysidine(34) synthetase TilS [Candidatus Krumholzibacteria bacterium]MDH4337554.1 tRNA lysidine(34) synthetase TilS [Candidatus Krumholzibacteria bacterium]MDH5269919.1 tRNA lysidine(34) synthetase TilS [Candidatus Krumholzibacteria bacterium]